MAEDRISRLIEAAESLKEGRFDIDVPVTPTDDLGRLGLALRELAATLESHYRELQQLGTITTTVSSGFLLDEVLDRTYDSFKDCIPYNRIGCALMDPDGLCVRAHWARADYPGVKVMKGYSALLAGSSLQTIFDTGRPRILNDLIEYLRNKPGSESTRLIVAEGIRSSLTCPLIANGIPVGFLFFSSAQPNTYAKAHVEIYERIAQQMSIIVEKGRLVSQLAEQKAAIDRQNEQLRRVNEIKDRFLGTVAHDLRNPIGNVQAIATLMLEPDSDLSDAERRDFLRDIVEQTQYMLPLLNDLLDVAQIESSRLTLHKEALNVKSILTECVERQDRLAEPKKTRVVAEVETAGYVQADPIRVRQVLDNLLSNAVKFSPPGSCVRLRAEKRDGLWRVAVQDEGPGVTEEDKARLFHDFSRLSATPTGGEKSTGLGLAISRRIIEAHGGHIGVDSLPGSGATFWFTLPV